jgi:hypothetical protein
MKLPDFLAQFKTFTGDIKAQLATANETIKALTARLEKVEADDSEDNSKLDEVLEQLREILNEQAGDDTEDSDSTDDSTDDSDAAPDDSDEDNDETDSKAKASTKKDKVKAVADKAAKLVAEHKALKASVPKKVISTLAQIGIPAPVTTKVDGQKATALTGLARTAAAFTEQLSKK